MILSTDSFNRPDSINNLGSTDGTGPLDPLLWTQQSTGIWGISSNQAYSSTSPIFSGGNGTVATVNLSIGDYSIQTLIATAGSTFGLVFRFTDMNNFFLVLSSPSSISTTLYRIQAGTFHNLTSGVGVGTGNTFRAVCQGSAISIYRDFTTPIIAITDTFNQSAPNAGLATDGDTVTRFDNWQVGGNIVPSGWTVGSIRMQG